MKNNKGFSLIELMITVAVIGAFIVVIGLASGLATRGANHNSAVEYAKQWAKDMSISPSGIDCTGVDSDGDGYVSCSVAEKHSDGTTEIHPIECAKWLTINSGCRTPKLRGMR